jgi:hypothetical protein
MPTLAPPPAPTKAPEGVPEVFEGEGSAEWMMYMDAVEYTLAAEISDTEAIELRSLAEAKRHPNWPFWQEAIFEELATLKAAGTWKLVDPPQGANIVGSKWYLG